MSVPYAVDVSSRVDANELLGRLAGHSPWILEGAHGGWTVGGAVGRRGEDDLVETVALWADEQPRGTTKITVDGRLWLLSTRRPC